LTAAKWNVPIPPTGGGGGGRGGGEVWREALSYERAPGLPLRPTAAYGRSLREGERRRLSEPRPRGARGPQG